MTSRPILRIAVASRVPGLFDYLPGADTDAAILLPGVRVRVPFGRGRRLGLLIEVAPDTGQPRERLKPIEAILDREPILPLSALKFLIWAADYYRYPLGDALFSALPGRLRQGRAMSDHPLPAWRLSEAGRQVQMDTLRRAPRQAQVLHLLESAGREVARDVLYAQLGACGAVLRALVGKGWIEPCQVLPMTQNLGSIPASAGVKLNADQAQAVQAVQAEMGRFQAFLLEGVTGSGKTEVYIKLIERALEREQQVLLLVPEIGLTPQLQRRLQRRLAVPPTVLHSGLAQGERADAWLRARAGDAAVLLGTRSAVFTPLPRLGLIVVDEEHDLSFKQQDGFRYSARDLAVRRAQQGGCPVVLGSATPSLETLHNARSGRYQWLRLPRRAGLARPPRLDLIDIRSQPLRAGLSPVVLGLMQEQFGEGNQVLLFLNRRGFAPVLTCHACGWVSECPHCDARLTLHQSGRRLWCHHCGYQRSVFTACPACGVADLRTLGQGTERLEQELRAMFPAVPLARIDRDSTRRKGELERILTAARRGDYALLLGTQMLAKGHHFPNVTLVGVLDIDRGLYGADYRAAERMAQLLVQVAGRSGRAEKAGRVVMQTRHPDHPLLQTLIREGYTAFAEEALRERAAAALPPFAFQALLRAEALQSEVPYRFLERARATAESLEHGRVELWGPVPALMERRAGRFRAHLLTQAPQRSTLQAFLAEWVAELYALRVGSRVRWSIDVDPQEVI